MATEEKDILRIADTFANVIAEAPENKKTFILSDTGYNNAHIWKYDDKYHFPAVSKSTADGVTFDYHDETFKNIAATETIQCGDGIIHTGDTDTGVVFDTDVVSLRVGNTDYFTADKTGASAIGKTSGDFGVNVEPDGTAQLEVKNTEATVTKNSVLISHDDMVHPITSVMPRTDGVLSVKINNSTNGGAIVTAVSSENDCGPSPLTLRTYHGSNSVNEPACKIDVGKRTSAAATIDPLGVDEIAVSVTNDSAQLVDLYGDGILNVTRLGVTREPCYSLWLKSSDTTVANTVAETSLGGTIVTFPANYFRVGHGFRLRLAGFFSTKASAAGTLTVKVKLGSTIIAQSAAFSLDNNLTNQFWELGECCFGYRTLGASGTIMGQCGFKHTYSDAGQDELHMASMINTSAVVINTTISQALTVTAQFSVADVANTITCTCGHVDEV